MIEGYSQWSIQAIAWVQTFRNPLFDALGSFFSLIGDMEFFIAVVAVLIWCVDKRVGVTTAILLVVSGYINVALKNTLAIPRPSDPGIVTLNNTTSYSFPSGHAQTASTVWGYWGVVVGRLWAWALFSSIVVLVSLSRVYNGAHYPGDVAAGAILGITITALYLRLQRQLTQRVSRWPLRAQIAVPGVLGITLGLLAPVDNAIMASGALVGIAAGQALERRYVQATIKAPWRHYVGRVVLGSIGLALLALLDLFLEHIPAAHFTIAALTGLWVTLGAPYLFTIVRLSQSQITAPIKARPPMSASNQT